MIPAMLTFYVLNAVTTFRLPNDESQAIIATILWALFFLSGIVMLGVAIVEMRRGSSLPRVIFILTNWGTQFGTVVTALIILNYQNKMWLWPYVMMIGWAVFSTNHWLAAIGISFRVWDGARSRHDWRARLPFILTLGVVSVVFGAFLVAVFYQPAGRVPLRFAEIVISFRLGAAIVHFLYDRWSYQFHRPEVAATIGKDLFRYGEVISGARDISSADSPAGAGAVA